MAWRLRAEIPQGLRQPFHKVSVFHSGREALTALLRHLHPAAGVVLMPPWVAEGVFLPFQLAGWDIIFYDLDQRGHPRFDQIHDIAQQKEVHLCLLVHFFGILTPLAPLQSALPPHTAILEDWAQGYPTDSWKLAPGHWALFSPNKLAGVPDGAWLLGPEALKPQRRYSRNKLAYGVWRLLYLLTMTLPDVFLHRSPLLSRIGYGSYARSYRALLSMTATPHTPSCWGSWLLRHYPHDEMVQARRQQAAVLHTMRLPDGVNRWIDTHILPADPLIGYPLLVDDVERIQHHLQRHGIRPQRFTDHWWFGGEAGEKQWPGSYYLMQHHLLLPLNLHFSTEAVAYLRKVMEQYSPSEQGSNDEV
ncbi:MAG: hypothetical protein R2795_09750 [Saprospiraceae bacterium]